MLQVIGLGYPRTGTMSLKHALEMTGFGPCYHMIEVFERPADAEIWRAALSGNPDWETVFRGFQSTTDTPACYFWQELITEFPDAKCILTVRPANDWYESFHTTVYQAMMHPERSADDDHRNVQNMARELILDTMFDGQFENREKAIQIYEDHNREVIESVPEDRLLVFDVSEGWEPLCRFLKVPTPTEPFPCSNTRSQFQERFSVPQGNQQ